jgi:nucleotide-binding universal stress UspA family protein
VRRPVVCAVDDTPVARHAAHAASWLARALDTELVLAHAFDPMGIPALPRDEMVRRDLTDTDVEHAARVAALRLLDHAADVAGAPAQTELLEGRPVPELLALATARGAALLVAGTAARGRLDLMLAGSTAAELAAGGACPLVAVPPDARLEEPGPVVAGYDGSEHGLRAARYAADLAKRLGREHVLVHVTNGDGVSVVDEFADGGLVVAEGDPAIALATVADERSAALVVSGPRGRSPVGSAVLGSVSAGLVRAADRPVVLVPPGARMGP